MDMSESDLDLNKETDDNVSIPQALINEKNFFENHEAYSDIAEFQGIGYLRNKLSKLLSDQIKMKLPKIHKEVVRNIKEQKKIIKGLSPSIKFDNSEEIREFVFKIIDKF